MEQARGARAARGANEGEWSEWEGGEGGREVDTEGVCVHKKKAQWEEVRWDGTLRRDPRSSEKVQREGAIGRCSVKVLSLRFAWVRCNRKGFAYMSKANFTSWECVSVQKFHIPT